VSSQGLVSRVSPTTEKSQYPYSKNRVLLSALITILSTGLALTLLQYYPLWVLYYLLATLAITVITFFLKQRLYSLMLTAQENHVEDDKEPKRASWKSLLAAFVMLLGFVATPLLLAGFLDPTTWFILITGLMSGVSISEIALYVQASRGR
jgi:uncharacterized membrane protein